MWHLDTATVPTYHDGSAGRAPLLAHQHVNTLVSLEVEGAPSQPASGAELLGLDA